MGCALVFFKDAAVCQAILQRGSVATIAGVKVQIKADVNKTTGIFVAWGKLQRYLSADTIMDFFESRVTEVGALMRDGDKVGERADEKVKCTQKYHPMGSSVACSEPKDVSGGASLSCLGGYLLQPQSSCSVPTSLHPTQQETQPELRATDEVPEAIHQDLPSERQQSPTLPKFGEQSTGAALVCGRRTVVHGPGQKRLTLTCTDLSSINRAISVSLDIPEDEQHLLQEPPAADGTSFYRLERKMDARQLHFCQAHISPNFRDGRPIYELLNDVNSGGVDPLRELEPLDVVHFEGKWWSLSNRRLWVLKHCSAATSGQAMWVRVQVRPPDGKFRERLASTNGGTSVRITRSRSASPVSRGRLSDTTVSSIP